MDDLTRDRATSAGRTSLRELAGQFVRFVLVGTGGTVLYLCLYAALRMWLGVPDVSAAVGSWVLSTVLANLGHRQITFSVDHVSGIGLDSVVTFGTALVGLLITTLILAASSGLTGLQELATLVFGTAVGGLLRFGLTWKWFRFREDEPRHCS